MIRLAEIEDLYEISKIHTDNRREIYKGILSEEYLQLITYEHTYARWRKYFLKEDREIIVSVDNGEIVGFAAIKFWGGKTGYGLLDNLHVRKNRRGRGKGTELIRATASLLSGIGVEGMYICVVKGNVSAERSYIHLGAQFVESFIDNFEGYKVPSKKYVWEKISYLSDEVMPGRKTYDYDEIYDVLKGKFCVWGSGEFCNSFFEQLGTKYSPNRIYDVDPSKWGVIMNGVEIQEPCADSDVIIASRYYDEIEKMAKNIGCKKVVAYYPWHKYDM